MQGMQPRTMKLVSVEMKINYCLHLIVSVCFTMFLLCYIFIMFYYDVLFDFAGDHICSESNISSDSSISGVSDDCVTRNYNNSVNPRCLVQPSVLR